jgi:hypothetical protein
VPVIGYLAATDPQICCCRCATVANCNHGRQVFFNA